MEDCFTRLFDSTVYSTVTCALKPVHQGGWQTFVNRRPPNRLIFKRAGHIFNRRRLRRSPNQPSHRHQPAPPRNSSASVFTPSFSS